MCLHSAVTTCGARRRARRDYAVPHKEDVMTLKRCIAALLISLNAKLIFDFLTGAL